MKNYKKLVSIFLIVTIMAATGVCSFAEKTDPEPRVSIVRPIVFKYFK